MNLLCALLDHRRALPVRHNAGLSFTICQRCGADLVRERRERWHKVPPGSRVVWRAPDVATPGNADAGGGETG